MEWKRWYLDVILVPLALVMMLCYHIYLSFMVRTHPFSTLLGINSRGRRIWICSMIKENQKMNILAVQTLRNIVMGATLMATTCVLLCAGLAAVLSSTYSIKKPLNDAVFGAHGDFAITIKYLTILTIFIFSFFFHSLSIRFLNQVAILVNIPNLDTNPSSGCFSLTSEHVSEMFEKGIFLNTVGNRLFYTGFSLMLWIFGPILVFFCVMVMVLVLYNLDFVTSNNNKEKQRVVDCRRASSDLNS
ncbi:hypothetical protein CARUB_v10003762mg [Capsella rubella]|uniref:DUF599 domain-containing protein n=1 Tax=Capsella rubella TaxID=81985 RepID=R0HGW8_9BRAS|nr:uncharacterized protein LOC17882779 [Capsella rubella]EOA23013.1 hypothetical protein CARUB_v10003762mg [Capsella rubella]